MKSHTQAVQLQVDKARCMRLIARACDLTACMNVHSQDGKVFETVSPPLEAQVGKYKVSIRCQYMM